jgi:hypothetical protein
MKFAIPAGILPVNRITNQQIPATTMAALPRTPIATVWGNAKK